MLNESEKFLLEFKGSYGDFISHREFDRMCAISFPSIHDIKTQGEMVDAMKDHALKRLRIVEEVRDELLEKRQMLMASVRGEGFKIIHPQEQTMHVLEVGSRELARAYSKISRGLNYVNRQLLSPTAQAENDVAKARIAGIASISNRKAITGK